MDASAGAALGARLAWVEALYWRDPNLALREAQAWLDYLGPGDHGAVSRRLDLVLAAVRVRRGDVGQSAVKAQQILDWAVDHGDVALQSRCHRLLGSVFDVIGDRAMALEHAVAALDFLDDESETPIARAAVQLGLADALDLTGSHNAAEGYYREALRLVQGDDETTIQFLILNNLAYNHFQMHRLDEALAVVDRLITASDRIGRPLEMFARETIGRIYLTVGRDIEAEQVLMPATDVDQAASDPDSAAACLVTLSDVYRARNRPDHAQWVINLGQAVCRDHGLTHWVAEISREQAEIFALAGDFRSAFETYREFHQKFEALEKSKNEARGRILDAMFPTTRTAPAQPESQRSRELLPRDPLTGLHNRRFVDEQLDLALTELRDGGPNLTIALVDLDHFQRTNDQFSHQVGDEVLRMLGQMLNWAADFIRGGVAARMGGEEFLLVLPDLDPVQAVAHCEMLRQTIADYDWSSIRVGLAVTASIGVARAPADGQFSSVLLHTADERLNVAKSRGRNLVVGAS